MTAGSCSTMAAMVRSGCGVRGTGRGRLAARALLSAFLLALPLASTSAQTGPEQQPAVAPLTNPDSGRDAVRQQAADERMAALLLSEAREELELGDLRNARRRLEILVTRFASTSVGARARRLLEQLSLIDGAPMPPMPKAAAPVEPKRSAEPPGVQLATRSPGASLLEADFSASGGDRLFFADGSDDAGGRGRRILREKANWLRRHPQVFVRIEGYADDSGNDDMNSSLALRRAESVRDILVEAGVSATRMHISAFGRENRIATCADAECAAQNRRAILILTDARGTRLGSPLPHANAPAPGGTPLVAPSRDRPGPPGRRDR